MGSLDHWSINGFKKNLGLEPIHKNKEQKTSLRLLYLSIIIIQIPFQERDRKNDLVDRREEVAL